MAKLTVAQLPAKLYELLEPLSAEERVRVVQATLILFGDEAPPAITPPSGVTPLSTTRTGAPPSDAAQYFEEKAPANKGEMLAVAARFRELTQDEHSHSKTDLRDVVVSARRNFDSANFARDINNAKRQAGFFNLGTGRDASRLSYYGQNFIDALPDREAAGKLQRPKVGGGRKKAAKKTASKK